MLLLMYAVFRTQKFDKELEKQFSAEEQKQIGRFEKGMLKQNPHVGDPLGYEFFREKKIKGKRVYFLVYDDVMAVLMVGISDKKTQSETIEGIKNKLKDYHEVVKQAIKQHDEYDRS
jgi:putative component of toxin-antitoxin plasmid stabilization module